MAKITTHTTICAPIPNAKEPIRIGETINKNRIDFRINLKILNPPRRGTEAPV